ncbi:MAG: GNAT family N-acetyltransferase [Anaerolineales bacterium]|nr:GNAT family N-acetyltransferase [Anaerolineales bacterium]
MNKIHRSNLQPIFRLMEPGDGPKLVILFRENPDDGRIAISPRYQIDPYQAIQIQHPTSCGLIAEIQNKIIGFALVRFGVCQVDGAERPYAWLNSLMVDSAYRQQGLGKELALRRVALARERVGEHGLILTSVQSQNTASLAIAKKWAGEQIGQLQSILVKTSNKAPAVKEGFQVREVELNELGLVADGLNAFYSDFALYEPQSGESLAAWLRQTVSSEPINKCFVALNAQQEIVAGLMLSQQHRLMAMQVERLPRAIHLLNKLIKMVPPDNILRQMAVSKIWHQPGHQQAAQMLWQTVRWESRSWGSHLTCFYDPQSNIPQILQTPKWLPKASFALLAQGRLTDKKVNLVYPL